VGPDSHVSFVAVGLDGLFILAVYLHYRTVCLTLARVCMCVLQVAVMLPIEGHEGPRRCHLYSTRAILEQS
jgi:hypothetical protein